MSQAAYSGPLTFAAILPGLVIFFRTRQLGMRLLSCVACLTLLGCATSHIYSSTSTRTGPTGIGPGDRISVVLLRQGNLDWETGSCLVRSIESSSQSVLKNFVDASTFLEKAFPGEGRENVGRLLWSGDYLRQLVNTPTASRIATLHVRYLIVGHYATTVLSGPMKCSFAGLGIACGSEGGRIYTTLTVDIVDATKGIKLGTAVIQASGSAGGGFALILVIPIPFGWSAHTESASCEEVGHLVADLILGREPQDPDQMTPAPQLENKPESELEVSDRAACLPNDTKTAAAILYRRGKTFTARNDYRSAMACFLAAQEREQGTAIYRESCVSIGMMYEMGWGVDQDLSIAQSWYKKAGLLTR